MDQPYHRYIMSPALRIRFWLPTGTDSDILDLLAEAYFQNGDLANAIESEEKALRLLPLANGRAHLATRRHKMELRLAKFKTAQKHR